MLGLVGDAKLPLVGLIDAAITMPFTDESSEVRPRFTTAALALSRASLGEHLGVAVKDARIALSTELDLVFLEAEQISFVGTRFSAGLAHEAALQSRGDAQVWTEAYHLMEYRHVPVRMVVSSPVKWDFGETSAGMAAEVELTGANFEKGQLDSVAEVARAQRVALALAFKTGSKLDEPQNLNRYLILEH